MGTLITTPAGFATFPTSPPVKWPQGVAWPGGQSPNGSKIFTINDADLQAMLTWVASNYVQRNQGVGGIPTVVTAPQLIAIWLQAWTQFTQLSVQRFLTPDPVSPPLISII